MPHFRLETNVPQDKIPADFSAKLCGILSKSLGKPINYCCATVIGGVDMSWGSTKEPAAQATLMSIGALGIKENKKHAKALFECVSQNIDVPADRMYISFTDSPSSAVGYNGTTFHEILEGLDMSNYTAVNVAPCCYSVYALLNQSGTTYSGHYTVYCRQLYAGMWHKYNDSRVSNFTSNSIVSREAYVLFYEQERTKSHP